MQPREGAPLDFSRLDGFIREFQRRGFTEAVIALKSHSSWASIQSGRLRMTNAAPKPEHRAAYAAFLTTDFLAGDPPPEDWPERFDVDRYGPHWLAEIRAILDRPDLFDVLNIHALGHPGEIERIVRWLG